MRADLENEEVELELYHKFMKLLQECETPEEFMMTCAINGYGDWGTKKFFDTKIFPFLFGDIYLRGKALKMRLEMKKNILFLQQTYATLIDEL